MVTCGRPPACSSARQLCRPPRIHSGCGCCRSSGERWSRPANGSARTPCCRRRSRPPEAAGEQGVAADAAVALAYVRLHTDPETSHAKVRAELEPAIGVFEQLDDRAGLGRALSIAGMLRLWRGEAAGAIEELERAAQFAREAGDRPQEIQNLHFVSIALLVGSTTVSSALEQLEEITRRAEGASMLESSILRTRAHLEAMRGSFDTARRLIVKAKALTDELGFESTASTSAGEIELLAGDLPAAEHALRAVCETLERRRRLGPPGKRGATPCRRAARTGAGKRSGAVDRACRRLDPGR